MSNALCLPLFRTARFANLGADAKKSATISVRITFANCDVIYTQTKSNKNIITGFQDPKTGLFITNLRDDNNEVNSAHNRFRQYAVEYAQQKITEKVLELKQLHDDDADAYRKQFKPLDIINRELSDYLVDRADFYADLEKQIALVRSNARPHINEYVCYQDDEIQPQQTVTTKVDYQNPLRQSLTDDQIQVVETFLNAFVDRDNLDVLAWYFGAMLSNLPIYDERVSKMMIVSSARGGSGKSTLIQALAKGLLTDAYWESKSVFDSYFALNNRFGTSQILPLRLVTYGEAEFRDGPNPDHNFDGLNVAELKSMISDGYVAWERKYEDMQTRRLSSFQIVLTNHNPIIDEDRQALKRRILPLVVRPNSMAEKGLDLNLNSEKQIYQYVHDNVQAFANYFTTFFNQHDHYFTKTEYDYRNVVDEIQTADSDRLASLASDQVDPQQLKQQPVSDVIQVLGQQQHLSDKAIQAFIQVINQARQETNPSIRYDGHDVWLTSTRHFYLQHQVAPLRNALQKLCGKPQKKFCQRMWRLTADYNQ